MNYLTSLFQAMKSGTRSQKTHAQELPEYVYRPEVDSISFEDGMAALKKFGLKVVDSAIDNTSPSIVLDILNLARKSGINFLHYEININEYNNYFNNAEYKIR